MQILRNFRQTLRRKKNINEVWLYYPLEGKNGYIIEYRHPNFSQVFHYKYKENPDGTLTKYGYLLSGQSEDGRDKYGHKVGSHDNRKPGKEGEKDYIFFQTVADKEQIALERRWLQEVRFQKRISLHPDESHEWQEVMQHNNRVIITNGIQRRRVHEVLDKMAKELHSNIIYDEIGHEKLPMLDTITRIRDTPVTPHSSPTSPTPGYSFSHNSLLNINIRQRSNSLPENKKASSKGRLQKYNISPAHLVFSQREPVVYEYDPEESLVYKECRCEYCIVGDYNQ
ncbi:hypothetical protein G9A89_013708 [Geosiphon pyriformis]|nr:hypothetical protein G9A89_013708 [Geosiphon pyriformis]